MSEPVRLAFPWVLLCSDNERHTAGGGKARAFADQRSELSRDTPINPRNAKRVNEREAECYGEKAKWIRTLPCYVTDRPAPSVAAHVVSRGAGGKSAALVPFHALVEYDWHAMPEAVFEAKYGVSKQDCKDAAERYEAAWQKMNPPGEEVGE